MPSNDVKVNKETAQKAECICVKSFR